jgi:hypothetical protein
MTHHCPSAGCNYPEGECSGHCMPQMPQGRSAQACSDTLKAASWCLLGLLCLVLLGMAAGLAMALADFLQWHLAKWR